jgi:chloramphenicol 3-O phosphotransferase
MDTAVIVLNGGSSSGKTSIARCLQDQLPGVWLSLGVDDLIATMPDETPDHEAGITYGPDGQITVGPDFRRAEAAWYQGIAAMARSGTGVIVDEVFLGGRESQERLATALGGLVVLWVGVTCNAAVAAAREAARPDRIVGMAESQAASVHQGVRYDVTVDTTDTPTQDCARVILERVVA